MEKRLTCWLDQSEKLKVKLTLIAICVLLSSTALGDEYTLAPDGTYVGGDTYTLAPDGTYVGGDNYALAPDGTYVGEGEYTLTPDDMFIEGDDSDDC